MFSELISGSHFSICNSSHYYMQITGPIQAPLVDNNMQHYFVSQIIFLSSLHTTEIVLQDQLDSRHNRPSYSYFAFAVEHD
jgi:hypothetical protein